MNVPTAGPPAPRRMGIAEPVTVLTDLILGALAFVLAVRLGYDGAANGQTVRVALAFGLLAAAIAAFFGAAAHATNPVRAPQARRQLWRLTLHSAGLVGALMLVAVAFFAVRDQAREAILWAAAVKFAVYTIAVAWKPEFRILAIDYGLSLAATLIGAAHAYMSRRSPGSEWVIAGTVVSFLGAVLQARRVAPGPRFNHNDLYHVIQMVALYVLFRGGALLVDR